MMQFYNMPSTREIFLNKNENPFDAPPALKEEIRKSLSSLRLNRYPDPDAKALKAALSEYTGFPAERIVVGNGGDEILFLLFAALIREGDRVLTLSPCFSEYNHLCKLFRAEQVKVPVVVNGKRFSFSEEAVLDVLREASPRLVLLDSPHNPTGMLLRSDFLLKVIEHSPGICLIDEAYAEFSRTSILESIKGDLPREVAVLRTMSKAWGLAGMRVGYAMCGKHVAQVLNETRSPFNVNVMSQDIAKLMLSYREWMEGRVYAISYIRDRFVEEVNRIPGWQAFESTSNFVAVRAPLQRQQLEEFLLQQGIHVKFISVPWEGTWMRVTVGKENEMQLLISAFSDLTQQAEGFPSSRVTV